MKRTFKHIFRNLSRKPVTTIINLFGLSLSLALVLILSVYSFSEFNTDKFHKNQKDIYLFQPGEDEFWTPGILKPTIDNNIPGVEKFVRIKDTWDPPVFQFNQNSPVESDLLFSDKGFFEMFDYQALEGDLKTALDEPMSLVISKSLAAHLFGKEPAVGKIIKLNNEHNLTVRAVLRDQTSNTIFSFSSIANIETLKMVQPNSGEFTNWNTRNFQSFLQLNSNANFSVTKKTIVNLLLEKDKSRYANFKLLPLNKIYFTKIDGYITYLKTGSKAKVIYLTIVALLVLIVALVNFINITSAHWHEKIKQTGIIKVIGAKRSTITFNMLFETFLLFIASLLLGYVLVFLVTPFLAQKTDIIIKSHILFTLRFLSLAFGVVVLLSVISGIIPALRIASSETLTNLKKRVVAKSNQSLGKGILVSLQFIVAIILILFTILIQKQVDFGSNNLGINQENIVCIKITDQLHEKKEVLKESLLAQANIEEVIFTQYYPGKMLSSWGRSLQLNGKESQVDFNTFSADEGFFNIMGLELLRGRFYDDKQETDKNKVIVNEQFLREYGIINPIGGKIAKRENIPYEIIGVVKDFNFRPVNEPIAPLVIRNDKYASVALVKLRANDFKTLQHNINNIKELAGELSPAFPVSASFFDQAIERMYQTEVKFRKAFTLFAICAIVISCMGILAMSLFATQQRVKEIGIRKVNGAKISEILMMLNKDFVKWVTIAFLIACPIAWYAMNKWLENFAYKTELSWWIFALAGLLALGIALLTVSWQSWRAATRNPVEALRYE